MSAQTYTAFQGPRRLAAGELAAVAAAVAAIPQDAAQVLIFEDATGQQVELDLRHGAEAAVREHANRTATALPVRQGRGRPKLGVVAREVTLLPRHWDWLGSQPGGASAAIRRLVEDARRGQADAWRRATETAHRVMTVLAGDAPGYEEALRALYAADRPRLERIVRAWPPDVSDYVLRLAGPELTA